MMQALQAHAPPECHKRDLDDSDASELDLSGSSSRNNSPPNKRPKFERTFVPAWLSRYPWLRYDNDHNTMFCELCVKHRKSNAFTEGCQNFRRDNLNKHINTQDHRAALEQEAVTLPPLSPALPTAALGPVTVPLSLNNGVVHIGEATVQNGDVKALPITPNYLASPPFPYLSHSGLKPHIDVPINLKVTPLEERDEDVSSQPKPDESLGADLSLKSNSNSPVTSSPQPPPVELRFTTQPQALQEDELVIKIRVANAEETDFIEVELDRSGLTFDTLLQVMCQELQVDRKLVQKVRKLPNTIVRKNKDARRLTDFQELELVLNTKSVIERSADNQGISSRSVGVVLY